MQLRLCAVGALSWYWTEAERNDMPGIAAVVADAERKGQRKRAVGLGWDRLDDADSVVLEENCKGPLGCRPSLGTAIEKPSLWVSSADQGMTMAGPCC